MAHRIGFISTRFAGTDGVSLESAKWAQVMWESHQHVSFWYAGRLDRARDVSFCVPEAYFGHPVNEWINERIWGPTQRSRAVTDHIRDMANYLKDTLYQFTDKFDIDLLIPENVLTIPMHVPLGIAVTELIAETGLPSICHNHDFYWERVRFQVNAVEDYLDMAFPPRLPSIQHAVINQAAREQLAWRKGIPSTLVPNVIDYDTPAPQPDEYSSDIREQIGLEPDDVLILQPTRVVPRKGIEHAIKLVQMLGDPKYKLVVSHEAGDEGYDYLTMLTDLAHESNVDIRFFDGRIAERRQRDVDGRKLYTLWDVYPYADLVTYPSVYEGFGNALLEAIYFRVPVLINHYSIFDRDIEPKGFRLPIIDGMVTRKAVEEVRRLMEDDDYRLEVVDHNYEVARQFYGYPVIQKKLDIMIANVLGD